MSRILPRRALVVAPLFALLLAANASATTGGGHREQMTIESWSMPGPAPQASPKLFLHCVAGRHYAPLGGTGKTMAAEVIASR